MNKCLILHEAMKMFLRRQKLRFFKIRQYKGDDEEICRQIVDNCFNGTYFQTSTGHFDVFYMRDFGICCEALLRLGYKEQVEKTLQYALNIYQRENKITTTITRTEKAVDMFYYSPDSLAFLLYCLRVSQLRYFIEVYKPFLNQQIQLFYNTAIDKNNGLVNNKQYSSMKDHSKVKSSCYNNCMAAMIKQEIELIRKELKIELDNPLLRYDYPALLKKYFWNGSYFNDGLYDKDYTAGDANVFPFWCRIFDITKDAESKKMFSSCLAAIQTNGLDKSFPLRYTTEKTKGKYLFLQKLLAPNYEGDTIWMHLGLCYLDVIAEYDKDDKKLLERYLELYKEKIAEDQNFLEVYNVDGKVYKTFLYHADEGMLWAGKYLKLVE
ncbi:hypothetical protein J4232_06220 [Candidatus Woesearchaeota archaeon]|nr:hypothetical protein [Candidatus Woesearchaeota archaeon]